MQLTYKANI